MKGTFYYYFLINLFIFIKLQLSAFSPLPSTPLNEIINKTLIIKQKKILNIRAPDSGHSLVMRALTVGSSADQKPSIGFHHRHWSPSESVLL